MRAVRSFALAGAAIALSMASFSNQLTSRFAHGPIILGGGGPGYQTDEDRRRRNLAAGGREKRIKRDKSRRFSRPRRSSRSGAPRFGRLFKSDKREAAFNAALADGKSRNEAAKLARRIAA